MIPDGTDVAFRERRVDITEHRRDDVVECSALVAALVADLIAAAEHPVARAAQPAGGLVRRREVRVRFVVAKLWRCG